MTTTYQVLTGAKPVAGSIRSWVNYDSVPAAQIVAMAEDWIWRRIKTDINLLNETGVMVINTASVARPARFRTPKLFEITGTERRKVALQPITALRGLTSYDSAGAVEQGPPLNYAVTASVLELDTRPDQAYPYRVDYYGALAPLSETNPTNYLTDDALDLLLAVCKHFGFKFKGDSEAAKDELAVAVGLLDEIGRAGDMAQYHGAEIMTHAR